MKYLKFWHPDSGPIGGIIMSFAIVFVACIFWPPVYAFIKWWTAFWGV